MASKTTIAYHCDCCAGFLCNEESDTDKPKQIRHFEKVQVTIIEELDWASERMIYKQLCDDCTEAVRDFMREMRKRK